MMRARRRRTAIRAIAGASLTFCLVSCAGAAGKPPLTSQEAGLRLGLLAFADRFDRAQLAKDGPALERMIADDLVFIDGSGRRHGKREFIAGWTDPGDRFDPITLTDRIVIVLSPVSGMVSAETVVTGISGGRRFRSHIYYTDTFRRTGGEWRPVHIQVTRIPD